MRDEDAIAAWGAFPLPLGGMGLMGRMGGKMRDGGLVLRRRSRAATEAGRGLMHEGEGPASWSESKLMRGDVWGAPTPLTSRFPTQWQVMLEGPAVHPA